MSRRNAYCSFCRKSHEDVGPLVEGPDNVYICRECVPLCQSILDQEIRRRCKTSFGPAATDSQCIRSALDRLISGQERAKAAISDAACLRHEGRGRVLLIGPSRSSALLLAKAAAHVLNVPFATGDWRGLAQTGPGNLFFELLSVADFDLQAAERGIVFVGEMELLEAQDALQRLWQVNVSKPMDRLTIELGGILFVCGASFAGLDQAIVRLGRHPEQPIDVESLRAVGARPEWVAGLSAVAQVPTLDEENLKRIVECVDFAAWSTGRPVVERSEG